MAGKKVREEHVLEFLDVAIDHKWDEGTSLNREEIADEIGWSRSKLARVVRHIKETPGYGISISTSRGRFPMTVVSFDGDPLPEQSVGTVSRISDSAQRENMKRLVRSATTSFVAFNHSNKARTEGRKMKPYISRMRAFLMSLREQAVTDGDPYKIVVPIQTALALVGVRFDDDGDDGSV